MTQKKKDYSKTSAILAGCAVVAAVALAPGVYMAEPANGLTEEQVKTIVEDAVNGLNLSDSDKVDYIYAEAFKQDAYEAYGESLALDELDSRDFKKDLLKVLENETEIRANIESYRDIEDVRVLDVSTEILVNDDVKVTVEFKVDFFNDGDSDDEDAETAKYFVDFIVTDAANDDDDDREDAEVKDDFSFRFIKFYD